MKLLKISAWVLLWVALYFVAFMAVGSAMAMVLGLAAIFHGREPNWETIAWENMGIVVISTSLLYMVLAAIILLMRGENPFGLLAIRPLSAKGALAMITAGAGGALFLNGLFNLIQLEHFISNPITEVVTGMILDNYLLALLAIGVVVPTCEEVMFRGLIFTDLRRAVNIYIAVLVQALLFGLIHGNLFQFIYTFPLGILLAVSMLKYRSFWAPILLHLGWNMTSMLSVKLLQPDLTVTGAGNWLLLTLGLALLIAGVGHMARQSSLSLA